MIENNRVFAKFLTVTIFSAGIIISFKARGWEEIFSKYWDEGVIEMQKAGCYRTRKVMTALYLR
jgi:hypothetical protein